MPGADFKDLVKAAYVDRVSLSSQGFYKVPVSGFDFEKGVGKPFNYFTSGVAATEVQVLKKSADCVGGGMLTQKNNIMLNAFYCRWTR